MLLQMKKSRRLLALLLVIVLLIGILYTIYIKRKTLSLFLWNAFRIEQLPLVLDRQNPELLFMIGNTHFGGMNTYDVDKAQKYYIDAIYLQYDFLEAHYQLGRTYFIQGRFARALFETREALRLDPEFKKAYYMYGLISGYQGNYDEAIYGFSEFIKRDDFNWAGYNDLAWIYFQQGDYEKTRDTAREGLKRAETNPWLHNMHGTALMNLGEKEEAKQAFEIALNEANKMTPEHWGGSYPGNDPRTYTSGLEQMRSAIKHNLDLVQN